MTIQKLIFSGYEEELSSLFIRKCRSGLTTNTYFNSFSAAKWDKYTSLDKVSFKAVLRGCGTLKISGADIVVPFDFKEPSEVTVDDIPLNELGISSYVTVTGDAEIISGEYFTPSKAPNSVKIVCCICTYKREKELERNVKKLLPLNVDIFIADNGHTIIKEGIFASDKVHLFENKNYGGAAGFTRCIIESAVNSTCFSHVLLMDDDAFIEPFVIEKTISFLSYLNDEYKDYMIGGSYLYSDRPTVNIESGAYFDGYHFISRKSGLDFSDYESVIENEKEEPLSYNGWFYSCIPSSFVSNTNLPLPLFIHGDDQDYGMRMKGKIITLNGICIWHPKQNFKPYMNYYNKRNFLMLLSKYRGDIGSFKMRTDIFRIILGQLASFRYADAHYSLKGFEDFYKGIDYFKTLDAEEYNRKLLSWKQNETCDADPSVSLAVPSNKSMLVIFIRRLLNLAVPSKKTLYFSSFDDQDAFDYLGYSRICIVGKDGKASVNEKNLKEHRAIMKSTRRLLRKIKKDHNTVYREWTKRICELETLSFWQEYLEI